MIRRRRRPGWGNDRPLRRWFLVGLVILGPVVGLALAPFGLLPK